jgi:hypothetical protein
MNPLFGLALILIVTCWPMLYASLWLARRLDDHEEEL